MSKFKVNDHIQTKVHGLGFENAIVSDIFIAKKGKYKVREMYLLKIMNGIATMPVSAETNYQLVKGK